MLEQGIVSLLILVVLSHRIARRPSYEIFLRLHQALAAVSAYSIWRHLSSQSFWPRLYVTAMAGLFTVSLSVQSMVFLWKNRPTKHQYSTAVMEYSHGTVKLQLKLVRPMKLKAGQYINLWLPSMGVRSILQSHPFTVASWSEGEQTDLSLFIEPREGMTREMLTCCKPRDDQESEGRGSEKPFLGLISGPHGQSAPVKDFETVVMVASGFGVIAHLPYLKQLVYGHSARKGRTRRVHLVWKVEYPGKLPRTNSVHG
jgi:predicted ferric reductase